MPGTERDTGGNVMGDDHRETEPVSIALETSVLEALDDQAASQYQGDRERAIRALLERWLRQRRG